jgi:hypothetical protein
LVGIGGKVYEGEVSGLAALFEEGIEDAGIGDTFLICARHGELLAVDAIFGSRRCNPHDGGFVLEGGDLIQVKGNPGLE